MTQPVNDIQRKRAQILGRCPTRHGTSDPAATYTIEVPIDPTTGYPKIAECCGTVLWDDDTLCPCPERLPRLGQLSK